MTHSWPDLASQFPDGMQSSAPAPRCCCGRDSCAYLEHNDAALRSLERDLQRAAEAGQSLLARHEAYVLEAEEERRSMRATVEKLECDKKDSETTNARIIEDNRNLLDQLETVNNAVSDSEAHILSLNATLQSTRQELDRLNALAARTSHLESQLSLMEADQTTLHKKLASSEDGQRSAIQRWRDAERTIAVLQEQIDRIELEAKDESERHAEVMNRYERRQVVERQLESAAGRLKGAAAATTLGKGKDVNTNVVSHFVKDILADNASLQMGIMELREMLLGSNEEVQNLREQMILHQELPSEHNQRHPQKTLEKDLDRSHKPEPDHIPALHVHHHYHEPNIADSPGRQRSTGPRRVKRRRNLVASGASTPRSSSITPKSPRTPSMHNTRTQPPSSAATILSQTSASIPPSSQASRLHQLSFQSTNTRPSVAPSLESSSPHPSMSDFLSESSRPTSPDSVDVFSPTFMPLSSEKDKSKSLRNSPSSTVTLPETSSQTYGLDIQDNHFDKFRPASRSKYTDQSTIFEEPEHEHDHDHDQSRTPNPNVVNDSTYSPAPRLRKSASHESILSTLNPPPKHTLRHQQSLLFRGSTHQKPRPHFSPPTSNSMIISSQPITSATPVTARAISSSGAISTLASSLGSTTNQTHGNGNGNTLGKRVGGWVWGKWALAPMASSGDLRAKGKVEDNRATGVNQRGSLRGVRGMERVGEGNGCVEAVDVDEGLLRESLRDEG